MVQISQLETSGALEKFRDRSLDRIAAVAGATFHLQSTHSDLLAHLRNCKDIGALQTSQSLYPTRTPDADSEHDEQGHASGARNGIARVTYCVQEPIASSARSCSCDKRGDSSGGPCT